jgi:hypothetical protein
MTAVAGCGAAAAALHSSAAARDRCSLACVRSPEVRKRTNDECHLCGKATMCVCACVCACFFRRVRHLCSDGAFEARDATPGGRG